MQRDSEELGAIQLLLTFRYQVQEHQLHRLGCGFMSLVPVALSVFPPSPFVGDPVTVSGYSFILPDTTFNCSAKIGPVPSSGLPSSCVLLSSSRALVHLPRDAMISPSYVQLHFEPGNVTTTAATRLCPCSRVSGGTVCGCAADACAARL